MNKQENMIARDFGVGAAIGGSLGALGAVLSKYPVVPPTLRCGAVGGCISSCYLPITRFFSEQRGVNDPANHALAGSCSGYAAALLLAGVRATNVGIVAGAVSGVGIFFGMEAFENWRRRTGLAMAKERARQKPMDDLQKAWAARCLTKSEYELAFELLRQQERLYVAAKTVEAEKAAAARQHTSWWSEFVPIRQVSDEQVAEIRREKERMEQIRLRMEMQKLRDRVEKAAPGAARAEEETLRELQEWQRERKSEERERERARESARERESERARREDKTLAQR